MQTDIMAGTVDSMGVVKAVPRTEPTATNPFIDFQELHHRIPLCERGLRDAIRKGRIPSIRLPGGRRVVFHWESVQAALLRMQRGAE